VLVAQAEDRLGAVAEELQAAHRVRVTTLAADLGAPGACAELVQRLADRGIAIGVLVNNAGYGLYGPFSETDLGRELQMIQVNVVALPELTKRLLPGMLARERGRILNVASTAAFQPGPLMAVYYATKAYVLSLSEALADELEHTGVSVTALCPGPTRAGFEEPARLGRGRHLPDPDEVARAGLGGLFAGKRVVIPGAVNWVVAESVRFLPRRVVTSIVRRAQETVH
jgi:short-subunit dehydrogenase